MGDLAVVDRKAIYVLISKGGALLSLVRASAVFLDRLEGEYRGPTSVARPVAICRLIPLAAMMGLLAVAA